MGLSSTRPSRVLWRRRSSSANGTPQDQAVATPPQLSGENSPEGGKSRGTCPVIFSSVRIVSPWLGAESGGSSVELVAGETPYI